ncbi:MAG: hypothetical protein ABW098_17480, partial [Candidatus Thiodiazotropha sp.]
MDYFTALQILLLATFPILKTIALAVDSPGISEIIITGDFNLNMLKPQTARKINLICTQFSFHQSINLPTHFTENSSSLIDILLVSNKTNLVLSGVGDPFLNQEVRYHCPIFGIFKFSKPKLISITRHIWNYDQGNYNLLRNKAASFDWDTTKDNDINTYANNITTTVTSFATECIPNRHIKIKPSEPPWINSSIKRHIRKRKRAYRKAKRTNLEPDWKKFKKIRNKVVQNIRDSKQTFYDKIAAKLTSKTLCLKDWWSTLKTFIVSNNKTTIPPLEFNDNIYTDESDKANILNNFFHTNLNEQNATIPDIPAAAVNSPLNNIVLSPLEVESVLKILPVAKASGPDGLSNRVLRELSKELSVPYCSLFNQ